MKSDPGQRTDLPSLPVLPKGWVWSVPKDFCSTIASGSTPAANEMSDGEGEIPFIKVYNLTHHGNLDFRVRPTFISRAINSGRQKRSIAKPNDVLINIVGPPLGKVSIVPNDHPEWNINQAIVLFRACDGISHRYLAYAFQTQPIMDRLTGLAKATAGQFNIGVSMCRDVFPVPIAPSSEQARIADRIDELFTDIAAGVAALERVRRNLTRYRSAVLHAAVTGRLTAAWRAQHGPPDEPGPKLLERILAERRRQWEERTLAKYARDGREPPKNWRERYEEPVRPKTDGPSGLPDGWCWATLDQLSYVTGGLAKNQKEAGGPGMRDVPYLRVANVQRGYLDLEQIKTISAKKEDIAELRLKPGDVLFTEGGDRDKLGRGWVWEGQIEECIHQNHVFRARPYSGDMRGELLSHAGNSYGQFWFQQNGKQSVNLASISLGVLRQFPAPVPPAAEQAAIVEGVQEKLSQIDALETEIEHGLARAARLRQAVLKAAFEGRLVPQDPSDEPAGELLARIKAERETAAAAAEANGKTAGKGPNRRSRGTRTPAKGEQPTLFDGVVEAHRPRRTRRSEKR
jgi:type I restriction enzyme, S subunit